MLCYYVTFYCTVLLKLFHAWTEHVLFFPTPLPCEVSVQLSGPVACSANRTAVV